MTEGILCVVFMCRGLLCEYMYVETAVGARILHGASACSELDTKKCNVRPLYPSSPDVHSDTFDNFVSNNTGL